MISMTRKGVFATKTFFLFVAEDIIENMAIIWVFMVNVTAYGT